MDKQRFVASINSMCVYTLDELDAIKMLKQMLVAEDEASLAAAWSKFFKVLCAEGCADNLAGYISQKILEDDNVFSRSMSHSGGLPQNVISAVRRDLDILQDISSLKPADFIEGKASILNDMPKWQEGQPVSIFMGRWADCVDRLSSYYAENGFGMFAKYKAFSWRDRHIMPIEYTNPITLNELKSYEYQRGLVVDNTVSFIKGLPANNVLLYGDRGTGKSSTVHAVLNEFYGSGLRMIEMPKSAINEFPLLIKELSGINLKFIIFIDDLSFSSGDDSFAELKAALEGGLSAKQPNMLIYATSNLRHLVREKFSDRDGDELHAGDTMQEQLSLSDRFGLSVTFINPDRMRYFEILDGIAKDRGLDVDFEKLHRQGEQWALERGGRSPRVGRQFINIVESCVKQGLEW